MPECSSGHWLGHGATPQQRNLQLQELASRKADIDRGLSDVRVREFDSTRIIERGRKLLAGR